MLQIFCSGFYCGKSAAYYICSNVNELKTILNKSTQNLQINWPTVWILYLQHVNLCCGFSPLTSIGNSKSGINPTLVAFAAETLWIHSQICDCGFYILLIIDCLLYISMLHQICGVKLAKNLHRNCGFDAVELLVEMLQHFRLMWKHPLK